MLSFVVLEACRALLPVPDLDKEVTRSVKGKSTRPEPASLMQPQAQP